MPESGIQSTRVQSPGAVALLLSFRAIRYRLAGTHATM